MSFFESIIQREKRKVEHLVHHVREMIEMERITLPLDQVALLPHVREHIRQIAQLRAEIQDLEEELELITMVKNVTTSVPRLRADAPTFVQLAMEEEQPRKKHSKSRKKHRKSKK